MKENEEIIYNYIDYMDVEKLRIIIENIGELRELMFMGYTIAGDVYMDITRAINELNNEKEKGAIMNCLLLGKTYDEYSSDVGYTKGYISKLISKGIINISNNLMKGE